MRATFEVTRTVTVTGRSTEDCLAKLQVDFPPEDGWEVVAYPPQSIEEQRTLAILWLAIFAIGTLAAVAWLITTQRL